MPLAMCDARTVKPSDLVSSAHISTDYVRRNFLVKNSQAYKYYYLSRMTKEEVCAFMVFDSAAVGGDQVRKLCTYCTEIDKFGHPHDDMHI